MSAFLSTIPQNLHHVLPFIETDDFKEDGIVEFEHDPEEQEDLV